MKSPTGYVATCIGLVLVATAGLWPFLSPAGRSGLLAAGGLAVGTQLALHVFLGPLRRNPKRFAMTLFISLAARMTMIVAAAILLVQPGWVDPASFLLGLAGFFYVLVLLESAFLKLSVYDHARYAVR